ncbi:hypothetical protein HYALB_00011654 [Hymenoscyphus albidus]|uniref:Tim44-like domain-containing protein n=1 Tax=Hymenoscyphus albidus TaxID=595503 RepID=A0A9N9PWW4_9HELO|nr:hypothetical protein HYALB_00011654 [Hymenoscyphus albidus]
MAQFFFRPFSFSLAVACRTRTATRPPQRCFSQSLRAPTGRPGMKEVMPTPKMKSDASVQSAQASPDISRIESHPFELLPATYIPPPFFRKPDSLKLKSILHYLKVQTVRRAWTSFQDFLLVLKSHYTSPSMEPNPGYFKSIFGERPFKIRPTDMVKVAKDLHKEMYESLAKRDISTIKQICVPGLATSLRARIASRPRGEKMMWELLSYNRPRAKLVSHRAFTLPGPDGTAIRQAVVRIASTQRLTRKNKEGQSIEGSGKRAYLVEYVCIQALSLGWEERPWRIWGTVQPTSEEAMDLMKTSGEIADWV